MRKPIASVLLAAVVFFVAVGVGSAAPGGLSPPRRDHGHGRWYDQACSAAPSGRASCGAQVVSDANGNPSASSTPPAGAYGPAQLHRGYSLPTTAPNAQTIAIVDAYNDPNAESDLATFDNYYGLPACTTANGCFRKVNQNGGTSYPQSNSGWALEIALDVEAAHEICQNCKILLVEASSNSLADLGTAENEAVMLGATVISNSWGGSEFSSETQAESSYFNHPGIAIAVAAGDSGYGVEFPAASRYVTAVGGTTLALNSDNTYKGETVWSGTGSGCSQYEPKPSWQVDTGCSHRTVADVSADADPNTGAAVYDSVAYSGQSGWFQVGGTSLATPLVAAAYALTGNPGAASYGSAPYAHASLLHDITSGNNGSCSPTYLCTAGPGYDGPTGLGTPNGTGAFSGPPAGSVPGAPTGLAAAAGNGSVSLSWSAPGSNGGSAITSYKVYRGTSSGGEGSTPIASVSSGMSYTDTSVSNGTAYYYQVSAVNSVGEGARSAEASATPVAMAPGAPTGLSTSSTQNAITLSWQAPTGVAVNTYSLWQDGAWKGTNNSTSYTFTGLSCGTTYGLTVAAYDASWNMSPQSSVWAATSACSTGGTAVPGAP
jgi:subtilase family serine protease